VITGAGRSRDEGPESSCKFVGVLERASSTLHAQVSPAAHFGLAMFILTSDVNLRFEQAALRASGDGRSCDEIICSPSLGRSLVAGAASLALMMASAAVVRAQTVIGADGQPGADCFTDGCHAGNGDDGQPASSDGNSATAVGGNGGAGGIAYSAGGTDGLGGNGGGATATSSVLSNGSSKAVSTATATGGTSGHGAEITGDANGGNASATSHATSNGSGDAASFATANGGGTADPSGDNGSAFASSIAIAKGSGSASAFAIATIPGLNNGAVLSSYAETGEGGLAQAESQSSEVGDIFIESNATAKTAYGGVSVQSTFDTGPGSAEAIARADQVSSRQVQSLSPPPPLPSQIRLTRPR
jgi:hypothetical protein